MSEAKVSTLLPFIVVTRLDGRRDLPRKKVVKQVRYNVSDMRQLMDRLLRCKRRLHIEMVFVPWTWRAYRRGYAVAHHNPREWTTHGGQFVFHIDKQRLSGPEYIDELAGHCWHQAEALLMEGLIKCKEGKGGVPKQFCKPAADDISANEAD